MSISLSNSLTNGSRDDHVMSQALTPGQALSLLPHCERRLMRRTRAYFAARARLAAAREEFAQVERLAGEARVYRPVAA